MNAPRRSERRALAVLGAAFCAAALAMFVEGARGAADSTSRLRVTPFPTPITVEVLPRRDPFAGDPANRAPAQPTPMTPLALPTIVPATNLMRPAPFAQRAALRVTATVSGAHPLAVIDDAGGARIVTLGDAVGASSVDAIDANGLHLSNGTTVRLSHLSHPGPRMP